MDDVQLLKSYTQLKSIISESSQVGGGGGGDQVSVYKDHESFKSFSNSTATKSVFTSNSTVKHFEEKLLIEKLVRPTYYTFEYLLIISL
jgi:hypothetical protein